MARQCLTLLSLIGVILFETSGVNSIVGGRNALPGAAPYVVAVFEVPGSAFLCAGALVQLNWVLTTARCVSDKTEADLSVLAGSHRLLTNKRVHTVAQIERHLQYDATTGAHNLALLKLSGSAIVSASVKTIALNDAAVTTGTVTTAFGWGALMYGSASYSSTLQTLFQRTVSTADCRTRVTGLAVGDICSQMQPRQAMCTKDEGGPLVHYRTEKLVGIYSYGSQCSGLLPDVYVDVYTHQSWIKSIAV